MTGTPAAMAEHVAQRDLVLAVLARTRATRRRSARRGRACLPARAVHQNRGDALCRGEHELQRVVGVALDEIDDWLAVHVDAHPCAHVAARAEVLARTLRRRARIRERSSVQRVRHGRVDGDVVAFDRDRDRARTASAPRRAPIADRRGSVRSCADAKPGSAGVTPSTRCTRSRVGVERPAVADRAAEPASRSTTSAQRSRATAQSRH